MQRQQRKQRADNLRIGERVRQVSDEDSGRAVLRPYGSLGIGGLCCLALLSHLPSQELRIEVRLGPDQYVDTMHDNGGY